MKNEEEKIEADILRRQKAIGFGCPFDEDLYPDGRDFDTEGLTLVLKEEDPKLKKFFQKIEEDLEPLRKEAEEEIKLSVLRYERDFFLDKLKHLITPELLEAYYKEIDRRLGETLKPKI